MDRPVVYLQANKRGRTHSDGEEEDFEGGGGEEKAKHRRERRERGRGKKLWKKSERKRLI